MIVDNPTSHFTLRLKDPSIKGIEYKALDLEDKYGLSNISIDINIETVNLKYIDGYGLNLINKDSPI